MNVYKAVLDKFEKAYPLLMHQQDDNSFNRFGLEVGPGWYPLIFEMFGFMDDLQQRSGKAVSISQIKEKFGTLRIHCRMPCESVEQELIEDVFECLSAKTCDFCGSEGRIGSHKGLWATRCDKHRDIKHYKQAEKIRDQAAEDFLSYERKGVSTEDLLYVYVTKSEESDDLASLIMYEFPNYIENLKDGLMDKLTFTQVDNREIEDLAVLVKALKADKKRMMSATDASPAAEQVMDRHGFW